LVFLLELFLIKHLDHKDGVFVGVEGERLVPIRVERLLCSRKSSRRKTKGSWVWSTLE
jgi:hypothetical protein